jgi:hypothetical protein
MNGLHGGMCRGAARGLLAFWLACLLAGCVAGPQPTAAPQSAAASPPAAAAPQPTPAPPVKELEQLAPLGPERIAARIKELEAKILKNGNADPEGALAHELALLYINPANRSPDPEKALALLRTYLSRAAPAGEDPEADRLVGLLEAIGRLGRLLRESRTKEKELAGQVQTFQQREGEMKQREQDLLAEIQILQARIEKLKKLDLEMEKRRKSVR